MGKSLADNGFIMEMKDKNGDSWYHQIVLEMKDREIERLKQGYCELKEKCNKGECDCTHEEYNNMCEQNIKMDLEIERLNNIINEFEEWLKDYISLFDKPDMLEEQTLEDLKEVLDKLQELKGSDKSERNSRT